MNKSLELDPNNYLAFHSLGRIYQDKKEYDKAINMYEKVIELDKAGFTANYAHRNLIELYGDLGKIDKAENEAAKVKDDNRHMAWANVDLAHVYERQNLTEKAKQGYEKAISLDPTYV